MTDCLPFSWCSFTTDELSNLRAQHKGSNREEESRIAVSPGDLPATYTHQPLFSLPPATNNHWASPTYEGGLWTSADMNARMPPIEIDTARIVARDESEGITRLGDGNGPIGQAEEEEEEHSSEFDPGWGRYLNFEPLDDIGELYHPVNCHFRQLGSFEE
jgi:hypothetical protein